MTWILDTEHILDRVRGLLHLATQEAAVGLDLTVGSVRRLTDPGSLDFGGSEHEAAPGTLVRPRLRSDEDEHGWWALEPGTYRVRYNEALDLAAGELARIFPLERLLLAGASHPAFLVDGPRDPLETLLCVGDAGCRLKENCRLSRLLIVRNGRRADD